MNQRIDLLNCKPGPVASALLCALLAGCASEPTALERNFGESVQQATSRQSVRPPGTPAPQGPIVTDGVAAAHGIERYQQSFAKPPAPISVLNIQAAPAAMSPMSR